MPEFLDFQEISKNIPFKKFLDWQELPYSDTREGLKGYTDNFNFIVNTDKNLFFAPGREEIKGSVINFFSQQKDIPLRDAAQQLRNKFLKKQKKEGKEKKALPVLELDAEKTAKEFQIPTETLKSVEAGYCKRGLMKGRHAFQIRNYKGKAVGYVGYNKDKKPHWLFPKLFKNIHIYNFDKLKNNSWAIIAPNALQACYLEQFFPNRVISTLKNSMNEEQEEILKGIERLIILNKEHKNMALRMAQHCFVKVKPIENVMGMSKEDILA